MRYADNMAAITLTTNSVRVPASTKPAAVAESPRQVRVATSEAVDAALKRLARDHHELIVELAKR